jgi:hypothetical protein
MKIKQIFWLAGALAMAAGLVNAENMTFTCAATIDATAAGTCAYLNTVVAGAYTSTFTNVNANIYIQYGTTGLASSTTGFFNSLAYGGAGGYLADLTANSVASGNAIQVAGVAALNAIDSGTYYANSTVSITSALGSALGIAGAGLTGTTGPAAGNTACAIGTAGCYNGVVTLTNAPGTWYYDQQGGTEASDVYDVYAAVYHEVDEILGTSSCIGTQASNNLLTDDCDGAFKNGITGNPSDIDLFRFNSAGTLALNNAVIGQNDAGGNPYFSYNGGATNGANGKIYNTVANGDDYADYRSVCPGGPFAIQDAEGCPGTDKGLSILNDGGAEINELNAIGYDLTSATPEPGTMSLFGLALAGLVAYKSRRA